MAIIESDAADQLAAIVTKLESAAEIYFQSFSPSILQKTATDADGRFSLSYPRDKTFTLFAKAERTVGEKTKKYFWLINAPSGVDKAQIFLTSDNLVFADPDGYFQIKPKPEL